MAVATRVSEIPSVARMTGSPVVNRVINQGMPPAGGLRKLAGQHLKNQVRFLDGQILNSLKTFDDVKDWGAQIGVDPERAIQQALVRVDMPCWGFNNVGSLIAARGEKKGPGAGLSEAGNYPGRAWSLEDISRDLAMVLKHSPGRLPNESGRIGNGVSLHMIYGIPADPAQGVALGDVKQENFAPWVELANRLNFPISMNPTCWIDGVLYNQTLSSPFNKNAQFMIDHAINTRRIAQWIGDRLDCLVPVNHWILDAKRDQPVGDGFYRELLIEAYKQIVDDQFDRVFDTLEGKLFAPGLEKTIASHEFLLALAGKLQALKKAVTFCIDMGHFDRGADIGDKVTAIMTVLGQLAFHISYADVWDEDQMIRKTNVLLGITDRLVWNNYLPNTFLGLDFFDGQTSHIATLIGSIRGLRYSLLESAMFPFHLALEAEMLGDNTSKTILQATRHLLPTNIVWHELCESQGIDSGAGWLADCAAYEEQILSKR